MRRCRDLLRTCWLRRRLLDGGAALGQLARFLKGLTHPGVAQHLVSLGRLNTPERAGPVSRRERNARRGRPSTITEGVRQADEALLTRSRPYVVHDAECMNDVAIDISTWEAH